MPDIIATTEIPVAETRKGKNRYYFRCSVLESSQAYWVCQSIIDAVQRKRSLQGSPCVQAVTAGTCPAMAMQQEEQAAGHALYYIPYDPSKVVSPERQRQELNTLRINKGSDAYQRGWAQAGPARDKVAPVKTAPKPVKVAPKAPSKPSLENDVQGASFADALNDELLRGLKEAPPTPKPVTLKPLPGETPVAFARRRRAALAGV